VSEEAGRTAGDILHVEGGPKLGTRLHRPRRLLGLKRDFWDSGHAALFKEAR
jgi:hypothetical protein